MSPLVTDFPIVSREFPAIIFVNPAADGGRAAAREIRAKRIFEQAEIPVEFVTTNGTDEFRSVVHQSIDRGCRLLLALGGDGTFHTLVNAAFSSQVVVGLLPAGGGNDLAAALGLQKDFSKIAQLIQRRETREIDLVRVKTADGIEQIYAGSGGVGLDAEASRFASTIYRRMPGRLRYVVSALHAYWRFVPMEVRIEFVGQSSPVIQSSVLLVSALNIPTYGAGLRLAPDARIDDGYLELVHLKPLNRMEVLRLFKAIGYRPNRTLRAVLFMNEENGLRGGKMYAELAAKNKEKHIAAIESDQGGFTPRGFSMTGSESAKSRIRSWKPLLEPYGLTDFSQAGGGADIEPLGKQEGPDLSSGQVVLIDYIPDAQR